MFWIFINLKLLTMKKIFAFFLLSLIFISSMAQDNKPEANSFGLQYGISYGGTLAQELVFSGLLKKGIEIRGGIILSFSQTDNKLGDTISISQPNNKWISGYNYSETKSGSMTITPDISILKHFSTKNNLDPFIGGLFSLGIGFQTIQTQNINQTTGDNYYSYTNSLTKTPFSFAPAVSFIAGLNYFIVRNFAIGVDAGFGFTTAISNGKKTSTTIQSNSGINNPNTSNVTSVRGYDSHTLTYTVNLSGNGGLRFTYFIPPVKKKAGAIQNL